MPLLATATLALNPLDPHSLLASLGALGVFLVLLAETGLLIGFFLPGDSLLFTAGLLCATDASSAVHLSLPAVLVAAVAGALTGAQVGYLIGRKAGPALLDRPDRPRLQDAVHRADRALRRYGAGKAIVLARSSHWSVRGEPAGGHGQGAGTPVHSLAGRRWPRLGRRRHARRLRARLPDPEHRPLPATDHRRHHRGVSAADPGRSLAHPAPAPTGAHTRPDAPATNAISSEEGRQ